MAFGSALEGADVEGVLDLLCPDPYWRDVLALTWDLHTFYGREQVAGFLGLRLADCNVRQVQLTQDVRPRQVVRGGQEVIEVVFDFTNVNGSCRGVARLVDAPEKGAPGALMGWTIMSSLFELTHDAESRDRETEDEVSHVRDFAGPNWKDRRRAAVAYSDRDPVALVVGCGQAGLGTAAWLAHLGIDTLVVDKMKRVGDNWRQRYHALVLHNEVWANHLPFMPFPETWPTYIPKDMLADWFEAYAGFMELNVWTETEFVGATYDSAAQNWMATVRGPDGATRELRPRHIVMATGVSGIPVLPENEAIAQYEGEVLHSSQFDQPSESWRSVLVVGSGTSGHDVAQDLASRGIQVSLVQRSPTTVVSVGPDAAGRVYSIYREGMSTEITDLVNIATPYPVLRHTFQDITRDLAIRDRALLAGLRAIGFRLDFGEDETGFQMKYLRRGGGYYLDVGCASLLIDGVIKLIQFSQIERFSSDGVVLADGSTLAVDAIVFATGYVGQEELVKRLFGDSTADQVGPIWGFDEEGELRNMWRPTGQEGLWFTAGSLAQCRIFSRYLALQIQAREIGAFSPPLHADQLRGQLRDRDLTDVEPLASNWKDA